jgi:CubicO group peptidase (beta-lactamase class C family)
MKRFAIVTLAIALACTAQAQAPNTPAGHQLAGWLAAFNGGHRDRLRDWLATNAPSELQGLDRTLRFRAGTGGFDFRKTVESSDTAVVALVQERASDQFARITLHVEPAAPHRVTQFGIRAVARPPEFAIHRLGQDSLVAVLRARLERETAADRFAGAVLIAHNGKPVFEQAYGLADRKNRIPNTLDTRFRIGSMNKMFTAVAVLQLVQAGKIRLDDPLATYLPDYPNKALASKVTIHHLLTHTGGTGDIFGPAFFSNRLRLRTIHDYVQLYGARDVEFTSGSQWRYSNYGFILLGAVIEKVTGASYYDYVASHVFAPAGMTSTGSEPEDVAVPNRSAGYMYTDSGWTSNVETLPYRGTSAGGGYSTVRDLFRFALALRDHKLLDAHHTELLTTGKVATPGGGRYAYGFEDDTTDGLRCVGHGGGAPGMNGELRICPQSGYIVAVLSNLDPPAASRISQFVIDRLPAEAAGNTTGAR